MVKRHHLGGGCDWLGFGGGSDLPGAPEFGVGVFVRGVLPDGSPEADFHRYIGLVDFLDLSIGLETIRNDLKSDSVADRNHVNNCLASLVGLELECALVPVALNGMKDDVSIVDWFAVVVANNGDFNVRRGRRNFVFAPMVGVVILSGKSEGAGDKGQMRTVRRNMEK